MNKKQCATPTIEYLIALLLSVCGSFAWTSARADTRIDDYSKSGIACDLSTYENKANRECSLTKALLTLESGRATRVALPDLSAEGVSEYLILYPELDEDLTMPFVERVSRSLAVCSADEACKVSEPAFGMDAVAICLSEAYLAEASFFFEFLGEVSPSTSAGSILVCREQENYFLAFESKLSPSFGRVVNPNEPGDKADIFVIAIFNGSSKYGKN